MREGVGYSDATSSKSVSVLAGALIARYVSVRKVTFFGKYMEYTYMYIYSKNYEPLV